MSLTPPLKTFGGKRYLAKRILARSPRHLHYVEPFFGGGAVLLARDPEDERLWLPPHKGVSEVANDIDGVLVNFWCVLRNPTMFAAFKQRVEATPFSRDEWRNANAIITDAFEKDPSHLAWAFFVQCRQSMAGMRKSFTPLTRSRLRRGMNGNVSEWIGAVDGLADVHARLRGVVIENVDAVVLIKREDAPGTFFYCDSPYPHSTRTTTDGYMHEMTDEQHLTYLTAIKACVGKVMVSGYACEMYDDMLAGWTRETFDLPNNAAGGASKRRMQEVVWMNYSESEQRGGE